MVRIHQYTKFQAIPPKSSRKYPETRNWTCFTMAKCHQIINTPLTKISSVLKVFRIHHHAKFQRIPTLRWPTNVQKPQLLHNLLSQNDANMMKINKLWQNLISSGGGQDTSACQISGHSLRASFPGNALKPQIWPSSLSFFGLCHLVIWQMTLGKKKSYFILQCFCLQKIT